MGSHYVHKGRISTERLTASKWRPSEKSWSLLVMVLVERLVSLLSLVKTNSLKCTCPPCSRIMWLTSRSMENRSSSHFGTQRVKRTTIDYGHYPTLTPTLYYCALASIRQIRSITSLK